MELRPPQHLGVVAIEKGAFRSPSTKDANLTTTYMYIFYLYTVKYPDRYILNNSVLRKYNFNVKKSPPFQTIQSSISTQFKCKDTV